jgi:hypothetical protein
MTISYFTALRPKSELASFCLLMQMKWNAPSRNLQPFILIFALPMIVTITLVLVLKQLKLHALHKRSHHIDAPFLFQLYLGSKLSFSFETLDLRVSAWYIRKMPLLKCLLFEYKLSVYLMRFS